MSKALLLAAILMGPPAPEAPEIMHHFEANDHSQGSQGNLAIQLPLQAAAAGFDLWTTQRCLSRGTCQEANPLAQGDRVPYELKGATFLIPAALTVWANKTGRHKLAWWVTGLSVALQAGFGVLNLRF
jgi:hypothetical protein